MKFKKIYWVKNFETDENFTFSEDKITNEELQNYNDKGFNIYQSVNTFIGDRRLEKDLAEIKSCFIDIDFPEITGLTIKERSEFLKNKYETFIIEKLKLIKKNYNISPSEINITYKGFHILFNYEDSCFFIEPQIHKEINNLLNEMLGGDENARDLARVYKVPWFMDWKSKSKIKIKPLFKQDNKVITPYHINSNFNLEFKTREYFSLNKTREKKENLKNTYLENIEFINSQDCFLLLERAVNFLNSEYAKNLLKNSDIDKILNKLKYQETWNNFTFLEEDGLSLTSGLFIEKDENWIWKINDYSKKTRRGNYNFFKNWIFSEEILNDNKLFWICSKEIFWLSLNKNLSKLIKGDYKLFWDISTWLSKLNLNEKGFQEEINLLNKLEEENKEVFLELTGEFFKRINKKGKAPFLALISLLNETKGFEEKDTGKVYYEVTWESFFDRLWLKNRTDTKKEYKIILKYISKLEIPFIKYVNNKKFVFWQEIFKIWFSDSLKIWQKDSFLVEPLTENKNFIFSQNNRLAIINKELISYNTKSFEWKDFLIEIDWRFKNGSSNFLKYNLIDLFQKLNLNQEKKENMKAIRHHLKKSTELDFIKDYKIDKDSLYIFNYKKRQ